jgi:hypothetical protein
MGENMVLYTAIYSDIDAALADLDAFEQLHEAEVLGKFDAAVIDMENGKPHIAKRMDRPRARVIPEMVGGGALPRKELKEAAQELTSGEAGLVVVGEPTLEKGFDRAVTKATKVAKRTFDDTADQLADELIGAFSRTD